MTGHPIASSPSSTFFPSRAWVRTLAVQGHMSPFLVSPSVDDSAWVKSGTGTLWFMLRSKQLMKVYSNVLTTLAIYMLKFPRCEMVLGSAIYQRSMHYSNNFVGKKKSDSLV